MAWQQATARPDGVFAVLRNNNIPFVLATNNASLTQQQYLNKLAAMGVEDVNRSEILTSSMATARYLKEVLPESKKGYL